MKKIISSRHGPILMLLVVGLLVGILGAGDYGVSIDEQLRQTYADQVIDVYTSVRSAQDTFNETTGYYGPAFSVISKVGARILAIISPWQAFQAHHFMYYLSFLMAVFFIHDLCLRISGRTAAFLTAALFFIQPVLFGHAFINPKDIPFMAFFLATAATGFHAVDILLVAGSVNKEQNRPSIHWPELLRRRWNLAVLLGIAALLVLDLLFFNQLRNFALGRLAAAYDGTAGGLLQGLFNRAAGDAWKTPLEAYQLKVSGFFSLLRWGVIFLLYGLGAYAILRIVLRRDLSSGEWMVLLAAGPVLGLTISIRVFGLFAGGLVGLYALLKMREKSILPLVFYGVNAALIAYLTWPFLWASPLRTLYESVTLMSSFSWDGAILYRGEIITASSRPWHYVPWLLLIQLTLPAVVLIVSGFFVSMFSSSMKEHRLKLLLVLAWFVVPLAGSLTPSSTLYDNTRHLFFIVPPLFVFASTALAWILSRLKNRAARAAVVVLLFVFGTPDLVSLHPYQYVYYNELVGKLEGAYGRYEIDYWKTSVRELMEYVNEKAPAGAVVGFASQRHVHDFYSREDLELVQIRQTGGDAGGVQYSVVSLRSGDFVVEGLPGEEAGEIVFRVERQGVPLGYVIEHGG